MSLSPEEVITDLIERGLIVLQANGRYAFTTKYSKSFVKATKKDDLMKDFTTFVNSCKIPAKIVTNTGQTYLVKTISNDAALIYSQVLKEEILYKDKPISVEMLRKAIESFYQPTNLSRCNISKFFVEYRFITQLDIMENKEEYVKKTGRGFQLG